MSDIVRDSKGRIRSAAQQEASRLLFDDPTYAPLRPDATFIMGTEWITYTDLVERLRAGAK